MPKRTELPDQQVIGYQYEITDVRAHAMWAQLIEDLERNYSQLESLPQVPVGGYRLAAFTGPDLSICYVNGFSYYPFRVIVRLATPGIQLFWAMNIPDLPPGPKLPEELWAYARRIDATARNPDEKEDP